MGFGMSSERNLKNSGNTAIDICTAVPYISAMKIRSIRHKGLRRLVEDDDTRGIRPDLTVRIRSILAALISAADIDGVEGPPGWRIHRLSGDRAGTWSVSASGNWRITFDIEDGAIANLNLEDYH